MASRILGMGDVLTLIDKASEAFDQEDAEKLAKKARTADLTLDDFLDQMQSMKKMGGSSRCWKCCRHVRQGHRRGQKQP